MEWSQLSQEERDAAYANAKAVANSDELRAARAAASKEFRRVHPQHLDLRYGPRERNTIDLFPAADPFAPCIVFLHGGYWQRNSKDEFASIVAGPHARGWAAALPGYTLAPEASLGDIVAEVHQALDWLAAIGSEHGIKGKVVLSGWSAGGHLTAMCFGHQRVSAGLAISGVYELGPIRDTYLNEKLRLSDEQVKTLSPLRIPMIRKPLAISYGTAELPRLVTDSRQLHATRAAEHLPGPLIPVAGAHHFNVLDQLRDHDGELTRQVAMLID